MTKNIAENINKTGIITKKIISLFIPICLLLISLSLVNCPETDPDASTPGNGNGNGGGSTNPPQIKVEYREGVTETDALQNEFLLSLNSKPAGDVTVNITTSRSDGGTATVKLKDSTDTATETSSFIFTQQNWNIPQEFLLVYDNPTKPDQTVVRIVFKTTSTADAAYNDLIYYFSGNLTHLDIPEFRIHVHNAQSPEPEGAAGTDDRNIKVWFSLEPSITSIDQAEACATENGTWSYPYCIITPEETCEKAYGAGTWDSATSTCGSTITAETACLATTGNTWASGTCSITAEAACLATTGNTWVTDTCQSSGGSTITAETACEATTGNTWASGTCSITAKAACTASGKNWDSTTSTCVSYITAEYACTNIHEEWDSVNNICTVDIEEACLDSGNTWNNSNSVCGLITAQASCEATSGNTWTSGTCSDGTNTITAETACEATSGNVWNSTTSACGSIGTEDACAATLHGTWDSANDRCFIMSETVCEEARGVWNSSNSTCSIGPKLACDTALHTWINKAEPVCAITNPQSHDSDITITYAVTPETASAGTDYTAPTTTPEATTVIIPASETSAYIEIPLVADVKAVSGTTPADEGDEAFKVSITSASTPGANLSVADADAIVTIGDPNKNSNYFFPNRPLMRGEKAEAATTPTAGDTPSFECYVVNDTEDSFSSTIAFVGIHNSNGITFPQLNSTGTIDDIIALSEYRAESSMALLSFSLDRPFIRLFFNPAGSGYNPINNYLYSCTSSFNDGSQTAIKNVPRGRFGMLEFGQAYEYE